MAIIGKKKKIKWLCDKVVYLYMIQKKTLERSGPINLGALFSLAPLLSFIMSFSFVPYFICLFSFQMFIKPLPCKSFHHCGILTATYLTTATACLISPATTTTTSFVHNTTLPSSIF